MATTYDNASLVMIPSGVKESKLYSIKPTDGSGDFTFSRGTDTATRVNASGLIEKERGNQLLQSNTFDTTWGPSSSISVTGGQSGYDGTNDAWLLKRSDASARYINQNITLGSSVYTYSVYAKAESENWIYIWSYNGTGSISAYFDLSGSGAVGTTSGVIDANIESVGSSWFRCSITYSSNIQSVRIYPAVADNTTTGGITDAGVYIQDSQIETSLVATDYIETTTAAVYEGITDNLPRLDYSGGASCPSLLLEPSRTNVITSSEHLGSYSVSNVSVSYNNATSPEGVQNATLVTGDSGTATKVVNFNPASNGAYTISVFAKYDSHQWIQLGMGGVATYANFDIQNGVVGGTNGTSDIEDYGNGWYRCSVQTTTGTPLSHYIGMVDSSSAARLATSSSTNSFWAYGMQSEIGSYPTSYIPTYGTSASRAQDDVNEKTGLTSIIGQTEGTLFLDFVPNSKDFQIYYQVRTTGGSNVGQIDFRYQSSNLRTLGTDGGSTQFTISYGDIVVGERYKCAVRYKNNDCAFYVNGTLAGTDTSASFSSSSLDQVGFNENTGNFFPSADIKQALVFPTGLTNAELAALTTI